MNCGEKVLITGCGGMLGSAIYPYFTLSYQNVVATDFRVNETWLSYLDVRDESALRSYFADFRPTLVLHLAAETSLEYCENHRDIAEDTNHLATATIARLCAEAGTTLVYISTAGVFDGKKEGLYTEEDAPNPIMTYGRTKYLGELAAQRLCDKTFVIRAGWMMGGGREKEKKFIYKILKQLEAGRKEIFAVDDLWGTPTYTRDFAINLRALLATRKYGTYHMVCEGTGTRHDVAREILAICNRRDIKLTPVSSEFFSDEYFVIRPRSEMMSNSRLRQIGCNNMRPWRSALREYIKECFPECIQDMSGRRPEDNREGLEQKRHVLSLHTYNR